MDPKKDFLGCLLWFGFVAGVIIAAVVVYGAIVVIDEWAR